uniref:Uncharacterized protein n=1 Tax=viral metagenome TaxID=1070528 RepID=A0A6M3JN73_9ZZZZ
MQVIKGYQMEIFMKDTSAYRITWRPMPNCDVPGMFLLPSYIMHGMEEIISTSNDFTMLEKFDSCIKNENELLKAEMLFLPKAEITYITFKTLLSKEEK